jgi:preflagellin peptidase FlaK
LLIINILFVNIAMASSMLIFTSYVDLKKREVEDKVWIIFGVIGVFVEVYEIANGSMELITLLVSVGLAGLIGFGIFFLGLYGGADAKALVVLSIILPYLNPHVGIYGIVPLIVLTNGVLLSMILPIGLLIMNLGRIASGQKIFEGFDESVPRKLLACLLGYKSNGMPRNFQFPMEKRVEAKDDRLKEKSAKKFDFGFIQDEFESTPGTWVTPGIPLLVFFTIGFFVLLSYGDLVIGLVSFIARIL